MKKQIAVALAVFLLAGCSFAPEYERPAQDVPETWAVEPAGLPETDYAHSSGRAGEMEL